MQTQPHSKRNVNEAVYFYNVGNYSEYRKFFRMWHFTPNDSNAVAYLIQIFFQITRRKCLLQYNLGPYIHNFIFIIRLQ